MMRQFLSCAQAHAQGGMFARRAQMERTRAGDTVAGVHCTRGGGLSQGKKGPKGFVTPTETNVHGDALCFVAKAWARHTATEAQLNNRWRLVAVGGCWRLAVGGSWRFVVVGGWWGWAVPRAALRGCPYPKKNKDF